MSVYDKNEDTPFFIESIHLRNQTVEHHGQRDEHAMPSSSLCRCVVKKKCSFQVIDPKTAAMLGPGRDGEICVRGPTIMKGITW